MQHTELLETLLEKRGVAPEQKDSFLNPSYETGLHDPFLFDHMEKACVRIFEAMQANEKIVIYSDYDADGIPGGVILHDLFKKVGYANFINYIPDRHDEGYGLHMGALKQFIAGGVKLIITIDLGITAVAEVAQAKIEGIDTIILDHHLPHEELPRAYAILNPKVPGEKYPFKELCGAGVSFKLAQGFLKKYGEYFKVGVGYEKWLLDMAGLATLSDMVELTGENRVIAHFGMKVLQKTKRPGLRFLFRKMKLDLEHLSEDDLTFMLTPRLNAASRMDSPMRAFELLSETDDAKAQALADHLTKINDSRKTIVATIMKDVHKKLEKREHKEVIVIGDPSWRIGVLGLIASKITETYGRPSFVWGKEGASEESSFKGSCRSDGTINVVELMTAATDAFETFGGHELAGGFTVSNEKVHFLEANLLAACAIAGRLTKNEEQRYDAILPLADVTRAHHASVLVCAPFGVGNEKPVFLFKSVSVADMKMFGKEKEHLELMITDGGKIVKAIAFFKKPEEYGVSLERGASIDLYASMEMSYFMNRPELRLRIVDIA